MIQMPINVSPQNFAIDTTNIRDTILEFTVNADYVSYYNHRIYDYDTGELALDYAYFNSDFTPLAYNGFKLSRNWGINKLQNGKNYVHQIMMCQRSLDGSKFVYDMPVLGGKLQGAISRNKMYVASDITTIYPWGNSNGKYSPCDAVGDSMIIKINGESRVIKSYTAQTTVLVGDEEKTYGVIETETEFSFDVTSSMNYEIFSNFTISPQYFFNCRSLPNVKLDIVNYEGKIHVKGKYNQEQDSLIKYYVLKLYWCNNSSFWNTPDSNGSRTELVDMTNRLYSQNIEYDFYNCYRHDSSYPHGTTDYYKVVCEIVTQDDMVCSFEKIISLVPTDYSGVTGNTLFSYDLTWDKNKGRVVHHLRGYGSAGMGVTGSYQILRTNLNSGEVNVLEPHHFLQDGADLYGYDYTAATHANYKYELMLFDSMFNSTGAIVIPDIDKNYNGLGNFPCNTIEINEYAYYISDLNLLEDSNLVYHPNESSNAKLHYSIGDTWKFICNIQDTTVTNNLDRITHIGYSQYTDATSTDVNYMSGTLTAMVGYIKCPEIEYIDDIELVKAWRKFITQQKPFLLKSQKGDVWVVNITDNPTTQYQENVRGIPTTMSFSWAETNKIENINLVDYNATITKINID